MTKGRPWDIDEIRQLRELVEEGKDLDAISKAMVKTKDAIRQKMLDLGLKVLKEEERLNSQKKPRFSSSKLELPADLPTVEETLQILAAALRKGAEAGLDKDEVQRLQVVATLAKTYKEIFADYLDYRGLEGRLVELEAKYEALVKKPQTNAPA
jgi:hypothetical protein